MKVNLPNYKFCPKCASALVNKKTYFSCVTCGYKLFLHSADTTSVFIIKDNKVLLAKRKYDPKKGTLDSVGGFVNFGEHPSDGAKREVLEETNLKIKILEELPVNMDRYKYQEEVVPTLNFSFIAQIISGKLKVQDDVEDLIWFPINEIPFKKIGFETIKKNLKDLQKWYKIKK